MKFLFLILGILQFSNKFKIIFITLLRDELLLVDFCYSFVAGVVVAVPLSKENSLLRGLANEGLLD